MYNVHCTNTILHNYRILRNTPPSSANINRLNWEGGCYVSRILLISHWQNHTNIHTNTTTHKHMRSHFWKTPTQTLRTTHRNPKTRTQKIKTSIKTHKHWQRDRTLQFFTYCDFMVFVLQSAQYPANPYLKWKSFNNACQLHTLVLLLCLNFCTLVLNFSLPWCNFNFSRSLNATFESSTTSNLYRTCDPPALNPINHIGLELCPH